MAHHLFTPSYFNFEKGFGGGVCWSFMPWCNSYSVSVIASGLVGTLYLLTSGIGAAAFAFGRIKPGWWILLILCVWKCAAMMIDYRSMGNYHYMATIVSLAFLFIPGRALVCQAMTIGFYFASGMLKINDEWLSGLALHSPLHGIALEWLCAYAAILELVLVFALLSKIKWLRWMVLIQLAVFHAFSWQFVGYFYPVIMTLILSIFPLSWKYSGELKWNRSQLVVIALYALAQVIPLLQKGDPALVGRGRLFAVNMFDSAPECFAQFFVRTEKAQYEVKFHRNLTPRIRCDPLIFWNYGRILCDENSTHPEFKEIDFLMSARRESDTKYTSLFHVEDFCRRARTYNTLLSNEWEKNP